MSTDLTQEDREYLISQLERKLGTRPVFYLKFCSKKEHAQDVCDGNFYANTAGFFRKKEIESGERGQGDKNELILPIRTQKISMFNNETGDLVAVFDGGMANIRINDDENVPIVSFVGIPLKDMVLMNADDVHADFCFPFTDEEYGVMREKFGQYCVVLGARELEQHIVDFCEKEHCDYIFDAVQYCSENRIDRMQAFANCSKRRFLYKDEDLSYQREYRLAVSKEIPNDHFLRLGKMGSAKILPSESLQNIAFSIGYISEVKENAK